MERVPGIRFALELPVTCDLKAVQTADGTKEKHGRKSIFLKL
jgi:hypothetical protein